MIYTKYINKIINSSFKAAIKDHNLLNYRLLGQKTYNYSEKNSTNNNKKINEKS